ncbi:MAG: hypothetical protein LRZ97_00360 [Candidatus Pacebacteria bacterium]|nr:hypothetical protein [Candidatus Paceibacterota bacterium]
MFNKLLRAFEKNRDTIIFQVSEEFIEVTALRQDEEEAAKRGVDCVTETLYSKRVPIAKPSSKKVLDDLTKQMGALADTVVSSKELYKQDFNLKAAKIACILVVPLSTKAVTIYAAEPSKPVKVSTKLLSGVIADEYIVEDGLKDTPKDLAMYSEELLKVELNGYDTQRPLGKVSEVIRLHIAIYLVDPKEWKAIGKVLESTFHRDIKYIHMNEVVDVSSSEFCNEIYTVTELQAITNDIL